MKFMRSAVLLFCFLTLVVGVIYPLVVTSLSQLLFPHQAEGSFIYGAEGGLLGSSLIGQPFSDPKYFWPRPSASADFPYNPLASGGSQLSPTNRVFLEQVTSQVSKLQTSGISRPIPTDLVMASGSGLDPHISLEGALAQVPRVAKARNVDDGEVQMLVMAHCENRQLGFLGAQRVNVLLLNLDLDAHGR
jgi:K+-transporting ATPase ATPase C chain